MDNKKIGNLIASLRKAKGLTQQELGDMVGIGFRAVSKWERGITMPDISIINDLSKILGITSDELLSGEINKNNKPKEKKKINKTIKITISIVTIIILAITSTIIYLNNKTYVYEIVKEDNGDYYIDGQVTIKSKEMTIIINKLKFEDKKFLSTIIKNYNYEISSGDNLLFGYGLTPNGKNIEENYSIKKFTEEFRINHSAKTDLKLKDIIKNKILIIFYFTDENNNIITKKIECKLY